MHNPHTCVIKQGFSRELRLLTPEQFRFVFEQPSRASTPIITILSRPTKLDIPRLGLTVAKKYVKRANRRNRIKRICRESFRLKQQDLPCCDFVVIAKKGIDDVDNQTLYLMLEKLWQRLIRISPKA